MTHSLDLRETHAAPMSLPETRTCPSFHGKVSTLFGIHIVNLALTLLTLGLYHFWAKVKVRKYLFSQTEFASDRFLYHGSGKELSVGFLKAATLFGFPYVALNTVPQLVDLPWWAVMACSSLAVLVPWVFAPIAMIGSRRYRLSRTSWRGIRFSFHGKVRPFLWLTLKGTALTAITLGAYYPYYQTKRQAYLVSYSRFGNRTFSFDGIGAELAPGFVLTPLVTFFTFFIPVVFAYNVNMLFLLLLPFTVAPPWLWFLAKKQRFFWDHTKLGEARFRSTITARAFLNLHAGNLLLLVVTLGFAWPWTTVRTIQFHLNNLSLLGSLDEASIFQESDVAPVTTEGLANLLDSGFEFD